MTDRHRVPPAAELAQASDDHLVALAVELNAAAESCRGALAEYRETGRPEGGVLSALRVYERGIRTIREIQRSRAGIPAVTFEAARPVVSPETAYAANKAVNRLIGLYDQEHKAMAAWLDDDTDGNFERLETAHGDVVRALLAARAGVELGGAA